MFFTLLGIYNLGGGYLRWSGDLKDDAALEQRVEPREAWARELVEKMRRALWILLVFDFVFEELLGNMRGPRDQGVRIRQLLVKFRYDFFQFAYCQD